MTTESRAQAAWHAFLGGANFTVLHPLDTRRLCKALAFAYADGETINYEASMSEWVGADTPAWDDIVSIIETAPVLFRALDAARDS